MKQIRVVIRFRINLSWIITELVKYNIRKRLSCKGFNWIHACKHQNWFFFIINLGVVSVFVDEFLFSVVLLHEFQFNLITRCSNLLYTAASLSLFKSNPVFVGPQVSLLLQLLLSLEIS